MIDSSRPLDILTFVKNRFEGDINEIKKSLFQKKDYSSSANQIINKITEIKKALFINNGNNNKEQLTWFDTAIIDFTQAQFKDIEDQEFCEALQKIDGLRFFSTIPQPIQNGNEVEETSVDSVETRKKSSKRNITTSQSTDSNESSGSVVNHENKSNKKKKVKDLREQLEEKDAIIQSLRSELSSLKEAKQKSDSALEEVTYDSQINRLALEVERKNLYDSWKINEGLELKVEEMTSDLDRAKKAFEEEQKNFRDLSKLMGDLNSNLKKD